MKKKRPYHRPAYKKIAEYWRGEYEALRHECEGLKKKVKSLQMEAEVDKVECKNNRVYYNALSTYSPLAPETPKPLYGQPKHRTWWERLWGMT